MLPKKFRPVVDEQLAEAAGVHAMSWYPVSGVSELFIIVSWNKGINKSPPKQATSAFSFLFLGFLSSVLTITILSSKFYFIKPLDKVMPQPYIVIR